MEETKGKRWLAIYGAVLASQVQQWFNEGRGGVEATPMWNFMQEAAAVADLEAQVRVMRHNTGELVP
jgi:hypothetical protein